MWGVILLLVAVFAAVVVGAAYAGVYVLSWLDGRRLRRRAQARLGEPLYYRDHAPR